MWPVEARLWKDVKALAEVKSRVLFLYRKSAASLCLPSMSNDIVNTGRYGELTISGRLEARQDSQVVPLVTAPPLALVSIRAVSIGL